MTDPLILDPASGGRMFYFNKNDPRVLFGDIREMPPTELVDGRTFAVEPDQVMDFTDLPFYDNTFNLVVFDPPHCIRAGGTGWLAKKYGVLDKTKWREDLTAGFAECFRVLAPGGTLIFSGVKQPGFVTPPPTANGWTSFMCPSPVRPRPVPGA